MRRRHIYHCKSVSEYIEYCDTKRLHWSLDVDSFEVPMKAFANKKATDAIRKKDPKWMEEDANDGAT